MAGWKSGLGLLKDELVQRQDEGAIIPPDLVACIHAVPESDAWNEEVLAPLWSALESLPSDPDLAMREPDDLTAIQALRPDGPRALGWTPTESELLDRLHGAWTGRCIGCALGKPVESGTFGFARQDNRPAGRERIRLYLEARNEWPLRDYFAAGKVGELTIEESSATRDAITAMPPDDDTHYTLIGLKVLEDFGPTFTWSDVAYTWINHIPVGNICTAELQALLTFLNHSIRWSAPGSVGIGPEETSLRRNPYREWIGAQIRSDGWAWACAGNPEQAAAFAWEDAHWTHRRNGIYGAMFWAAVQAAAFVVHDPRELLAIGLSEIPAECRLALAIQDALSWWEASGGDAEACFDRCEEAWADMNPVHTINNSVLCAISVMAGGLKPEASVCTAVMAGLDTDCNGATVGSVAGAATGRAAFTGAMTDRINDTIHLNVIGEQSIALKELARRHAAVWQKVNSWLRTGTMPEKRARVGLNMDPELL